MELHLKCNNWLDLSPSIAVCGGGSHVNRSGRQILLAVSMKNNQRRRRWEVDNSSGASYETAGLGEDY